MTFTYLLTYLLTYSLTFLLTVALHCRASQVLYFASCYLNELEYGPMPNVMAAQPNIGGALCKHSVILFLVVVACRKFWLTPAARVPCSNAANNRERK